MRKKIDAVIQSVEVVTPSTSKGRGRKKATIVKDPVKVVDNDKIIYKNFINQKDFTPKETWFFEKLAEIFNQKLLVIELDYGKNLAPQLREFEKEFSGTDRFVISYCVDSKNRKNTGEVNSLNPTLTYYFSAGKQEDKFKMNYFGSFSTNFTDWYHTVYDCSGSCCIGYFGNGMFQFFVDIVNLESANLELKKQKLSHILNRISQEVAEYKQESSKFNGRLNLFKDPEKDLKNISKFLEYSNKTRLQKYESDYLNALSKVENYVKEIARLDKEAIENKILMDLLKDGSKVNISKNVEEIKKLLASKEIIRINFYNSEYFEVITSPISIKTDKEYFVGSFKIQVYSDGGIRMINLTKPYGGYHHPHVSVDGKPCLGNLVPLLPKIINSGEISKIIILLLQFLKSYAKDEQYRPYVDLEKGWGLPEDFCNECGKPAYKCSCRTCSKCGKFSNECKCTRCPDRPRIVAESSRCDEIRCPHVKITKTVEGIYIFSCTKHKFSKVETIEKTEEIEENNEEENNEEEEN